MSRKKFMCMDCGIDTGKIYEHYFINTDTWISVTGSKIGMLCIGCLENRLNRKLDKNDFPNVTINDPKFESKSMRLMNRMGRC